MFKIGQQVYFKGDYDNFIYEGNIISRKKTSFFRRSKYVIEYTQITTKDTGFIMDKNGNAHYKPRKEVEETKIRLVLKRNIYTK